MSRQPKTVCGERPFKDETRNSLKYLQSIAHLLNSLKKCSLFLAHTPATGSLIASKIFSVDSTSANLPAKARQNIKTGFYSELEIFLIGLSDKSLLKLAVCDLITYSVYE